MRIGVDRVLQLVEGEESNLLVLVNETMGTEITITEKEFPLLYEAVMYFAPYMT